MLELKKIVEGLLFVSEVPLDAAKIHAALEGESTPARIAEALKALREEYASGDRAFDVREVAGGYQFRTRPELSLYALRLHKKSPARLSRAALETLAVIAYRQPVLRAEIEKIRGVDAGGVLRNLLEKSLVRVSGRQDKLPGRPILYSTTARFLETFDLPSLAALPTVEEMDKLLPPPKIDANKLF
ncbi:MAG: SMC-Scp complex subunit ScpB [Deltaproteobacteria bacterium]|jgi:segregation and condensation protein B|nr:SMC-Scp complex subunit ScpB [Deltaproteobacteria bacterium]